MTSWPLSTGMADYAPAHLRGVIFDMDGVVVDSEPLAAIASGEEVRRPKPTPDVYLLAMRRLGLGPAGLVAIEDSASGVAAAVAAGLACVAVRTALTSGHDHGAAALTIRSLTELDVPTLDKIAAGGAVRAGQAARG